jgi:hypothetical protein
MSVQCLCDACSHLLFHEVRVELAEAVDLAWSSYLRISHGRTFWFLVQDCLIRLTLQLRDSAGLQPASPFYALSFTVWAPQPIVYSIVEQFYFILDHPGR